MIDLVQELHKLLDTSKKCRPRIIHIALSQVDQQITLGMAVDDVIDALEMDGIPLTYPEKLFFKALYEIMYQFDELYEYYDDYESEE